MAAFGQSVAAKQLNDEGIGDGDLFLFFGWFRQTEWVDDERAESRYLRYIKDAPDIHAIYGYLQVGKKLTKQSEMSAQCPWHPHTQYGGKKNNALFIARERLSFNADMPGFGVFSYSESRVLTLPGAKRATWKKTPALMPVNIVSQSGEPYHNGASNKSMGISYNWQWQEMILGNTTESEEWAKGIVTGAVLVDGGCRTADCAYKKVDHYCVLDGRRFKVTHDEYCPYYVEADFRRLAPSEHWNISSENRFRPCGGICDQGIYCRMYHTVIKSGLPCGGCPLLSGSGRGEGIECMWDDIVSGSHNGFPEPEAEFLRVAHLMDAGVLDRNPKRAGKMARVDKTLNAR